MRVEAGLGQLVEQQRAVLGIDALVGLELVDAVEGAERGHLGDRRRRDVEVLRQALDRPHQRRRHDQPADAPAGHREILGEAVDDDGVVAVRQRRLLGHAVGQAVIDLVGHEPHAVAPAGRGDLGEARRAPAWCRSDWRGWPRRGRRCPRGRAASSICARGRHPAPRGIGDDRHRVLAERGQDVAVAGIAGRRAAPPWRPRRTGPGRPARTPPTSRSSPPPAPAPRRCRSAPGSGRRCAARRAGSPSATV